jgi:hypothetical protein
MPAGPGRQADCPAGDNSKGRPREASGNGDSPPRHGQWRGGESAALVRKYPDFLLFAAT